MQAVTAASKLVLVIVIVAQQQGIVSGARIPWPARLGRGSSSSRQLARQLLQGELLVLGRANTMQLCWFVDG
jgi:hypothetical protein